MRAYARVISFLEKSQLTEDDTMPLRSDWSEDTCAVARGADVFADPWSVLVLREVFVGNRRFGGIRSTIGAAENVLSERLRRLVAEGLLRREPYGSGARQEYRLTAAGADALPVLNALAVWAAKHTDSPTRSEMHLYCTVCEQESASADWCTTCSRPLTVSTTAWERPSAPGVRIDLAESFAG
jgi:DNA-binding HxlR family transcriptional regulator